MTKRRKVKKRDREINSDVSIAMDIILFKLDRIEQKLDDMMLTNDFQAVTTSKQLVEFQADQQTLGYFN